MPKTLAAPALLCAAALVATPAGALGIVDPVNDFLPSYTGIRAGDLDVVSAFVTYDAGSNSFFLSSTLAAPVHTTASAFYVWGFDRGQGTERFVTGSPSIGAGVKFDSVVVLRQDGSATVNRLVEGGSTALPGAVTFAGNTVTATISASFLSSLGLADLAYTWNLWPRDALVTTGNAAVSDFAPDASNAVVAAVPEPETYALFAVGLATFGWLGRRRRTQDA